jgi:hypothetical protein
VYHSHHAIHGFILRLLASDARLYHGDQIDLFKYVQGHQQSTNIALYFHGTTMLQQHLMLKSTTPVHSLNGNSGLTGGLEVSSGQVPAQVLFAK